MVSLTSSLQFMRSAGLDGWLVYDYGNRNPVATQILGLSGDSSLPTSGRLFLWIPASGETPRILVHAMEAEHFPKGEYSVDTYASWQQMQSWLKTQLSGATTIAMEYSKEGMLPGLSQVDAGTIELVRSYGPTVVSSADLFQATCCLWDDAALASHHRATKALYQIKDAAFAFIREALDGDKVINEYDVRVFIESKYQEMGLETEGEPIVAVNENTRFPHYFPAKETSLTLKNDQWLLLDIWAREPGSHNVFSDITWMAYTGKTVPAKQQEIFDIVMKARDLCVEAAQDRWKDDTSLEGWELDRVSRDYIIEKGYGDFFIHTTGHNIGPGPSVHGLGAALNDMSAHDTRHILARTGFSVEPGIYLPDFGVRLELDMYVDPEKGPMVTTPAQTEITLI